MRRICWTIVFTFRHSSTYSKIEEEKLLSIAPCFPAPTTAFISLSSFFWSETILFQQCSLELSSLASYFVLSPRTFSSISEIGDKEMMMIILCVCYLTYWTVPQQIKLFFYWDIICSWCCDDRFIFLPFCPFTQCSTFIRSRSNRVGLKNSAACRTINWQTFFDDLWAGIIWSIILPFSVFISLLSFFSHKKLFFIAFRCCTCNQSEAR